MNFTARSTLIGAGVGAGLMFLLDPSRGGRRRAMVRDKMVLAARKARDAAEATRRDLGNRVTGLNARARTLWAEDEADDWTICERVRAALGRSASHPRAVTVGSDGGSVTLCGDVLQSELSSILSAVSGVRGVKEVRNQLTVHDNPRGVPALQGASRRPAHWMTWLKSGWSPTAILVAGAGTALAVAAVARRAA